MLGIDAAVAPDGLGRRRLERAGGADDRLAGRPERAAQLRHRGRERHERRAGGGPGPRRTAGSPRSCSTRRRSRASCGRSRPSATRSSRRAPARWLLALVAGWLIARAIAQRVRRLEVAAKQMAAGRFPGRDPGRLGRRAGAARRGVQRHAAPASPTRPGAQEVHRDRVARAAHAAVLAERVRRAARGRGARSRDAPPLPGPGPRPGRTARQAVGRPAGPVADSRPGRSSSGPSRSISAS